ncbi:MAG TPA: GTP cyclohydrolase I FolE [Sphingobacteriaceae bacterium]|nr:GTP cyclohydrolase I FolE [Sphingobacteriaceae bacterium]
MEKIQQAVRMILEAIGEDPQRPGLKDTPARVARAYQELLGGMHQDPAEEISVFFEVENDEMVLVKDIPFYSLCEHHLLPFFGKAHVAYIPRNGRITGLSKLARVVDVVARRPQVQERLTSQIADALTRRLEPRGVLVVMEAEHLCMTMRGIKKPGSITVTSAVRGIFRDNDKTRAEAFALIGH